MGFARVFFISSALLCVGIVLNVIPVQLPHPACHHRVVSFALREEPSPLEGVFAANTGLQSAKRLLEGRIRGSESIAFTPSGDRVFFADKIGSIFAGRRVEGKDVDVVLDPPEPLLQVPGRPLGLHAVSETELLVCDSVTGLLRVDVATRQFSVVADKAKTRRRSQRTSKIVMANDLDVAPDGAIYFTDSTDIPVDRGRDGYYSTMRTSVLNLLEGRASGRLLVHEPAANTTRELMTDLWYANGVALAKDGAFVAVVETHGFRVHRYWLSGPRAGSADLLIDHLPGFPDGISTAPDGDFWIAFPAPPPRLWWKILPFHFPRLLYAWISEIVTPPVDAWGYVVKVSPQGEVRMVLSDVDGVFIRGTSSVTERDGKLYMGNLIEDYISVFDLFLLRDTAAQAQAPPEGKEEL